MTRRLAQRIKTMFARAAAIGRSSHGRLAVPPAYTLHVINDSLSPWDFYLFQRLDPPVSGASTLAWMAQSVAVGARVTFTWRIEYEFAFANLPQLVPGALFFAAQTVPARLPSANQIDLTIQTGNPSFGATSAAPPSDAFYIVQDSALQSSQLAVGLGMSGAPFVATPVVPGATATFPAQSTFWLSYGTAINGGMVLLDVPANETILSFPPQSFVLFARLNADEQWAFSNSNDFDRAPHGGSVI